jgi:catechol 2,3-dioxygenase-like lactoylglutathione lyase family enzyme
MRSIPHVSLLVNDYDEAIAFYTEKLNFVVIEDITLAPGKRWVRIAPSTPAAEGCSLLLAQASGDLQCQTVGKQAGDRVGHFLFTDNFDRDFTHMSAHGVTFLEDEPRHEVYGTVIVFQDLYGNKVSID